MVRQELHTARRRADALSAPPQRPQFDAIAWNMAHPDARIVEQIEALRARLDVYEACKADMVGQEPKVR